MINYTLKENDAKGFEKAMSEHMLKAVKHFEHELMPIRTSRAHPSMVEAIQVNCYGSMMPLKEVASISAPEARMIVIQPWDKSVIDEIEKAITQSSDMGVTPQNDGDIIRLILPEMSSDRRQELIKVLHKKLEVAREAIRNVRKDFQNLIRDAEKAKTISEDFKNRLVKDSLQKVTDQYIEEVEYLSAKKEADIQGQNPPPPPRKK